MLPQQSVSCLWRLPCAKKPGSLASPSVPGHKPRERMVAARHRARVLQEIAQAKRRFGLPETAPVVSCSAAGREGFWLHRFLPAQGITTVWWIRPGLRAIAASVGPRATGWTCASWGGVRYAQGEGEVWRLVHVPSVAVEDQRHLHRALETLKQERGSTTTRIKGWLRGQRVKMTSLTELPKPLEAARLWDGSENRVAYADVCCGCGCIMNP